MRRHTREAVQGLKCEKADEARPQAAAWPGFQRSWAFTVITLTNGGRPWRLAGRRWWPASEKEPNGLDALPTEVHSGALETVA